MTHVLYYAPNVCTQVPHIALCELAIPFERALTTYARLTRNALPERLRGLVDRLGERPSIVAARDAER